MTSKNTKLINSLKQVLDKNEEILDIILFGSIIRGKQNPADTDILVLFKEKIDKNAEYNIKKLLEKYYKNISIISKTKENILSESFDARESILFEGISLISGRNIAQDYGFTQFGAFKYNFKEWDKLKKTKFYYALNGRSNSEGISDRLGCIKLSDSIVLVTLKNIENFREFLDSWNLQYIYIPMLIPSRLGRKKILE